MFVVWLALVVGYAAGTKRWDFLQGIGFGVICSAGISMFRPERRN